MIEYLLDLACAVRDGVRPWVVELRGGTIVGHSEHGDATFGIDAEAERIIADCVRASDRALAVYSESGGLKRYGADAPKTLLIVDPVDGTRNATCGFEGCMVSVAAAPYRDGVTLGDVTHGVLVDIVGPYVLSATRGAGVCVQRDGNPVQPPKAEALPRERWRWALNFTGRPAGVVAALMADLMDATSLTGSLQACNSTTFALSRLVTGQLHALADVAQRAYVEYPETADMFRPAGETHLTGSQPHDLAAALLIIEEAGGVVTDAWGQSLHGHPLLAAGAAAMLSTLAAAHPAVHAELLAYVESHTSRAAALAHRER